MNKHLNLISYFGGKHPHLSWLISHFPKGNYHFVDLMTGGANVALNVDYPLVTINDLNDNVVNLFDVLRDHYDEFLRALYFTPFSRSELYKVIDHPCDRSEKVEWARQYFIKCQMGYGANGSQNDHRGAGFEYKLHRSNFYKVQNWNVKLGRLEAIASKLRGMQIESRDAVELIQKVDRPGVVVYVDPPYRMAVRSSGKRYLHEVDDEFHENLLAAASAIQDAYVIISGYDDAGIDGFYDARLRGWTKKVGPKRSLTVSKLQTRECIWLNYDPYSVNGQPTLFKSIPE